MDKRFDQFKHRIGYTPTYAAAVGYYLMAFSSVEETLDRTIWAILGLSHDAGGHEVTTAIRDIGGRIMLLARLGKSILKTEKHRNDCSLIIRELTFLNHRRVDLVHSHMAAWMPNEERMFLERAQADRDRVKRLYSEYTTDYLCSLTNHSLNLEWAMHIFCANQSRGKDLDLPSLGIRPTLQPRTTP